MSIATAFPDAVAADPSSDREDWHETMLKALAEIGMELARGIVRREAAKAVDDESGCDPQLAFARVSRAVRQCVALSAHLRQQRRAGAAQAAEAPFAEPGDEAQMDRARHERVVARVRALCRRSEVAGRLMAAIETEAAEGDAERLLSDLDRRLDAAVDDEGFAARPIDEVIAGIRQDLGLEPRGLVVKAGAVGVVVADDDFEEEDEQPGWDAGRGSLRRGSG